MFRQKAIPPERPFDFRLVFIAGLASAVASRTRSETIDLDTGEEAVKEAICIVHQLPLNQCTALPKEPLVAHPLSKRPVRPRVDTEFDQMLTTPLNAGCDIALF